MKAALCAIIIPFQVKDLNGKKIAVAKAGQEWSGQLNADGDFLFWMDDKYGVLRLAKIKAENPNVQIRVFENQTSLPAAMAGV